MPGLFLTIKDVQKVIGKGSSAAQRLITEVKAAFNKSKFKPITVEEFSKHTGISVDLILRCLE